MAKIEDVIAGEASALMDIPGVTGVGQTEVDGRECIVAMVTHSSPVPEISWAKRTQREHITQRSE